MNREVFKVPLCKKGNSYQDAPKSLPHFRCIAGGCLLFILIVSLFIYNMFFFIRVRMLEEEIENMKKAVEKIRLSQEDIVGQIIGYDADDNMYIDDEFEEPEIFLSKAEDPDNDYMEYDHLFQNSSEASSENDTTMEVSDTANESNEFRPVSDLTKDMKDESVGRTRRNVVGATGDGVLVHAESYAEKKRRNNTARQYLYPGISISSASAQPSSFGSPDSEETLRNIHSTRSPPLVYTRQSRVMHRDDPSKAFRRVVKKSSLLKSGGAAPESIDETSSSSPDFTVVRNKNMNRRRNRQTLENLDEQHPRVGRIKPLPAIHYGGDASKSIPGQHPECEGDGRLIHNQPTFLDWKASDWVEATGMTSHFGQQDGVLTIKETGLYYIYAQIYYTDAHDQVGYKVLKNEEVILHCGVAIHTHGINKSNTCFTAGVSHLTQGDRISIMDFFKERCTFFEPGKSFFGAIKLGDIKAK